MDNSKKTILVTGGSGYIASWILKYLLEDGHTVHATVRSLSDPKKTRHLEQLAEESPGTLKLFEANLLQEGSFEKAMQGCEIVMHTASPFQLNVKDAQKDLVDPALRGTRNVLLTANETPSVKRVVLTSSVVAIYGDAVEIEATDSKTFTEAYWNSTSSLSHQPYSYSKTLAEKEAWSIADNQSQWTLTTINPAFVMGPSISGRTDSTSVDFMLNMFNGKLKMGVPDMNFGLVDVRDVASAHILAGLKPEASGRHILCAGSLSMLEIAQILRKKYGEKFPIPKNSLPNAMLYMFGPFMGFSWKFLKYNLGYALQFDNSYSKQDLGLRYRAIEDTLNTFAENLVEEHELI
ncbi:aldehyde reductase [Limibacter armeniacum]|uniref:SDR family oxidoreductase n=1 Tax=Limibacter armeniacum TaxID=466084 RepID=UPI002FE634A2